MEVNVVDTVDRGLAPIQKQLVSMNQDPIEVSRGPNGVDRMITEIIKKVKTTNSIDVLRIIAHGNSGVIAVTGGETLDFSDSAIASWNLPKLESKLKLLTPYFKPTARVELLGCYVATNFNDKKSQYSIKAGSDGEQLLKGLAKIWQVNVLASGNTAHGLPIASIKFVGLVVQATPDGGFSCVPAPEISKIK
jgi:hypothetical protein